MKILYAGNMANVGYLIVKRLRKDGVDIDLIQEKNPVLTSDPLHFDPELNGKYPDWIYFFDRSKSSWKWTLIKKMRDKKYDLIHGHVEFPIFAYLSRRPFIAHTLGSDLRELAFTNSLRGILLRRALKKAKIVFFYEPLDPSLLKKLNIKTGIHLPVMWDTDFYKSTGLTHNEIFTIFHPTSLDWRLKGNYILIKGFSKFLKNHKNSKLIIVDHGIDSEKAHFLIKELNIEKNVQFVNGPLNSSQLLKYYNLSDVVADQFILDGIGGIGAEAFSCEKPLLTYCTEQTYGNLYPEPPPAVNANTIDDVTKQLEVLSDDEFRKKMGKKGREWITKYHSSSVLSKRIQKVYKMVIEGKKIDEIRAHID